jgi:ribonuclease J
LRAHADLAEVTGVKRENIFICENGESLEVTTKGVKRGPVVPSGIVLVDGLSVGDTSELVLRERTNLGAQGIAVVACALSSNRKRLACNIKLEMHGIPGGDDSDLLKVATGSVTSAIRHSLSRGENNKEIKKAARSALLSILWERTNQRPMVVVNILEL